jgi:D-alanine-D-alanine ligase-like ATP-grasp enzyme
MARNIVFVAPFPSDITLRFVRAASKLEGITLLGVCHTLPGGDDAGLFADAARVENPLDTADLIAAVEKLQAKHGKIERIVGILEAMQVQLAEVRAHFGVAGTPPEVAQRFRDKASMKAALAEAGLPVARNKLLRSGNEARAFAHEVGFPLVLKPPAGMGSKSTYRMRSLAELDAAIAGLRVSEHNPVLAEEFLVGREFSFETITVNDQPMLHSISHYLPTCLEAVENPWIQWCCLLPRDITGGEYSGIYDIGKKAIKALGLTEGMTHMEWFQRKDGSLAIGEIAMRPPGANISIMMGHAYSDSVYRAWNQAVINQQFEGTWERQYAVGTAFLRGMGRGRVAGVSGIHEVHKHLGPSVCEAKLPTIGAFKNDSYEGDGYIVVRDRSTEVVKRLLKTIVDTVRVHYAD